MSRILLQINPTRRGNAFDIAAIGRKIEIRLQNLFFTQYSLKVERVPDLLQLSRNRFCIEPPRQPGQLHRNRRSPWYKALLSSDVTAGRPHQRKDIHTGMEI